MSEVRRISEHSWALHVDDGRVYTLSNKGADGIDSLLWRASRVNWERAPYSVAGMQVIPYGTDNLLPTHLRDALDSNNLAPGILERQMGLLYGQGAHLCRLVYDGGEIRREWAHDAAVESWLDSFDLGAYIRGAMTDYLHLKGFFNLVRLERGGRIGLPPRIASVEHIPAKNARLEWTDTCDIRDVRHIVTGDFEHQCVGTGVRVYPVYDRRDPARHAVSAAYNRTASYARDFYSVPQWWGALRWIFRGSEIPTIFKYVTDNGLNLAYHVHSPEEYWDRKREAIRRGHPDWDDTKVEEEIKEITGQLMHSLTAVLSGKENAGKFFHTVDVTDPSGNPVKWTIEPIDQKIKDFVDSQLAIAKESVSAITSGMGLHPSLSNVMVSGKLASGSEMLYAFKLFLLSDTELAASAILEPVNQAIAFNFPGHDLRLAFYHSALKAEEAVTEGDRVKNA